MTRNQLPEGVGKKIVEALKRQAEADIAPINAEENIADNSVPLTDMEDLPELSFEPVLSEAEESFIIEEDIQTLPMGVNTPAQEVEPLEAVAPAVKQPVNETFVQPENVAKQEVIQPLPQVATVQIQTTTNVDNNSFRFNTQTSNVEKPKTQTPLYTNTNIQINIPANVAILKNLISTLPAGVTKQTGAQIIRQTLEAMGIPMNNVLKEAQEVQEELNSSTRECMLKIQEYKTNILQLEQSVQQYQQNITQINDLVSLFLLTDKN